MTPTTETGATATAQRPMQLDLFQVLHSRWLWCGIAAAFCLARGLGQDPTALQMSLGDTDDSTRLVQVRQFMAGSSWFDMTLDRIGGATPLLSHWSRLIDAPLAMLLTVFGLVVTPQTAEVLTRIVWPTLLLAVFLRLLVREIEFRADERAAGMFLLVAVSCFTGLFQFNPGRIDHHNAMILCAVVGALALLRSGTHQRASLEAGALVGLSLAVGFEALALVVPLMALVGLAAVLRPDLRSDAQRFGWAFAAVMAAAFVLTVAPSEWLRVHCDALSANTVLLATAGAVALTAASRAPVSWSVSKVLLVMAIPAGLGGLAYAGLEPKCLAGPFGQVDPAIKPLWLDHVNETFNVWRMGQQNPLSAVVFVISQAFGVVAVLYLLRYGDGPVAARRALAFVTLVATLGALWQVKLIPYAAWLGVFGLTLAIQTIKGTAQLSALSLQLVAALLASQSLIGLVATQALKFSGVSNAALESKTDGDTSACRSTPAVSSLAGLPPSLIVAPIDVGPYIVALTPHRVLAAPYHRIGGAIVANEAILRNAPEDAVTKLHATGAGYLVLCLPDQMKDRADPTKIVGGGLQEHMLRGGSMPSLTPVPLPATAGTLRVWKIDRSGT